MVAAPGLVALIAIESVLAQYRPARTNAEEIAAAYSQAWTNAEEIAAAYSLDDLAMHNRRGPLSLRWIYVHMVRNSPRHAGHCDILREQILAAGGSQARAPSANGPLPGLLTGRFGTGRYAASRSS